MVGEDITPAGQVDPERFREGQRITWVSVGVNVVLTAMQVVVGLLAHSVSLIADAMHTLSDVIADAFVLYANRKGAEAADAEHPYGHGRIETAASLVLGLLLAATGSGILITAAGRLQDLGSLPPVTPDGTSSSKDASWSRSGVTSHSVTELNPKSPWNSP